MIAEVPTLAPDRRRTRPLDTFKLGYEFACDEIAMRRGSLAPQSGHDDNVVVVKAAQSA